MTSYYHYRFSNTRGGNYKRNNRMKRNKHITSNLNTTELNQLKKVNRLHFNNLPLGTLIRILVNNEIQKLRIK